MQIVLANSGVVRGIWVYVPRPLDPAVGLPSPRSPFCPPR